MSPLERLIVLTEKGNLISTGASIIRATSNGDVDAVRALLADGADVDQRGRGGHTALMVAAIFGHVEIARVLLGAEANVNLKDNLGLTARDWADRRGSWEVAQLLSIASPAELELSQENTPAKQPQPDWSSYEILQRSQRAGLNQVLLPARTSRVLARSGCGCDLVHNQSNSTRNGRGYPRIGTEPASISDRP